MNSTDSNLSSDLPILLDEQQKHLDLIRHLISHSELLLVVYGSKGAGKSLLSRTLCQESDNSVCLTCEQVASLEDVLDVLAQFWELPELTEDLQQARAQIVDESKNAKHKDEGVTLIIDDADQLEPALLKSIAEFALEVSDSVSMALFGQSGFADELQNKLNERPLYLYELTPLSLASAKELIKRVGIPLSDDEIQTLYQLSDNWPGSMLEAARCASGLEQSDDDEDLPTLTEKVHNQPQEKTDNRSGSGFGTKHLFALAGLATLLVMMLIYSNNYQQDVKSINLDLSDANLSSTVEETDSQDSSQVDYNYALKDSDENDNQKTDTAELNSNESITSSDDKAGPVALPSSFKQMEQTLESEKEPSNLDDTKPKEAEEKENKKEKQQVASQPKTKPKTSPKPNSKPEATIKKSSGFVVQFFGSYDLKSAKKFKAALNSTLKTKRTAQIYKTTRNQKNWYVTVIGPYTDRAAAKADIDKLSDKLKAQSPWVRSTQKLVLIP